MNYHAHWSPKHTPPAPAMNFRTDNRQYLDLCAVNSERKIEIIEYLAEHQPGKLQTITDDGFIEQLSRQFNATITLPRASK